MANPNVPQATSRFRSFAERYLLARMETWPKDGQPAQLQHDTILEARTAYNQIRAMSRTVED